MDLWRACALGRRSLLLRPVSRASVPSSRFGRSSPGIAARLASIPSSSSTTRARLLSSLHTSIHSMCMTQSGSEQLRRPIVPSSASIALKRSLSSHLASSSTHYTHISSPKLVVRSLVVGTGEVSASPSFSRRPKLAMRSYSTSGNGKEPLASDSSVAKASDANAMKEGEEKVKTLTEPPAQAKPSLLVLYGRLSKVRLGSMVVLSTIFGYLLAPGAFDVAMFSATVLGTSFTVASANSINQYLEVEYDSMMKRTRNRPLPAGHMTMRHALTFGVTTGALGTIILGTIVNPISAALAFANIILYTMVYTPMKRVHPLNTAVGAIVGAIPPLIGWAAQTGGLEAGAWVAFLVMALWQMPHFHALSWPLRFDYGGAGYRMLCNVAPHRVPIHTFAYTVASLLIAPFAAYTGLATPAFALVGTLPSLPWIYHGYQFYTQQSNSTARQTYKWSLYWLPAFFAILALMLSPDRDVDTVEDDVIAIQQQQQQQQQQLQQQQQ